MSAHKFWRLYVTAKNGTQAGFFVGDIEFRNVASGSGGFTYDDVTEGGRAFASSWLNNFVPDNAFNNNPGGWAMNDGGTRFISSFDQTMPQFVGSELVAPADVVEMAIFMSNDDASCALNAPRDFALQYADAEAGPWVTASSWSGIDNWEQGFSKVFTVSAAVANTIPTVAKPTINGTPKVGTVSSLTAGAVTGIPAPTSTYQWSINGVDIPGATGQSYTPVAGDATKALRVRQIASNSEGSANATSDPVTVTAANAEVPAAQAGQYRFMRLLVSANNGDSYLTVQEIEFRETLGGPDVTTPVNSTDQSSYFVQDGANAAKMIDNNLTDVLNSWTTGPGGLPQWASFDLGVPRTIQEVAIWRQPASWANGREPKNFIIQGSNTSLTANDWVDLKSFANKTSWPVNAPMVLSMSADPIVVEPPVVVNPNKPALAGFIVKTYGNAADDDFKTEQELNAWVNAQDIVALGQNVMIYCAKNFDLTGRQLGPANSNDDLRVYMQPWPGTGYKELEPDDIAGNVTAVSAGVKILLSGNANLRVGVWLEDFNIIQTAGTLYLRRDGWGQGGSNIGLRRSRMLSTSENMPITTGEYANGMILEDLLLVHDSAYNGVLIGSGSGGNMERSTVQRRNGSIGGRVCTGLSFARDNVVSGAGGDPIGANSGSNNYTDTPLSGPNDKMIYSPGQFFESPTNLRPAVGSLMIGAGSFFSISKNDANGNNRGLTPDAGAFQRIPAAPLVVGKVTSQVQDGQSLVFDFSVTNNPTSGRISLVPDVNDPQGAEAVGPLPITILGNGTAHVELDFIPPGKYGIPTATFTNGGGTSAATGFKSFTLPGFGGLVYDTGGVGSGIGETPPDTPVLLPPTLSIASTAFNIMNGKVATITGNVDLQGDPNGTVNVFAVPEDGSATLNLGPATITGTTYSKQAVMPKGAYRFKVEAVANNLPVSLLTSAIRVLGVAPVTFTVPVV